jgi:outer membrane immunogenic protein
MNKLLCETAFLVAFLAGPTMAADMPLKAPVAPPVAVYNWTGIYVGGHGGYAWTDKDWFDPAGNELASYTARDFVGGGQIGFNWQTGSWVFGAEAQASWGKIRKGVLWTNPDTDPWTDPDTDPVVGGPVLTKRIGTTVEHLGTVAARVGYAFDRVLVFGKGGAAWAHDIYRAFNANGTVEKEIASASDTRWGWMAGGGVEYAFAGNWSAKVEFDYLDFGTERVTLVSIPGVTPATRSFDVRQNIAVVLIGVNYRFALTR